MRFWNAEARFLKARFQIFFDCLLNMETNDIPKWFLPQAAKRSRR
jgi:hypothetical protein